MRRVPPVHPRVCGEQLQTMRPEYPLNGSSPRVRGTGVEQLARGQHPRFIPACTGNRVRHRSRARHRPVHPRVCGEQGAAIYEIDAFNGSSPRVRGTDVLGHLDARHQRFIPACAGNRAAASRRWSDQAVHPRVCGEQQSWLSSLRAVIGSSARVRGTGSASAQRDGMGRFIPACAGNSRHSRSAPWMRPVHPRVCGEQSGRLSFLALLSGSSPRVRGTVPLSASRVLRLRFIPACAGNRTRARSTSDAAAVHPRVCGEQVEPMDATQSRRGSSPRVRGTAHRDGGQVYFHRFIPACAGNSAQKILWS